MAIYHDENNPGGADVFLRAEPEPGAPPPAAYSASTGPSMISLINLVLVMIIVVGAVGTAWYVWQPKINLTTPVEESLPYRQSTNYLANYDEIVTAVGPNVRVRNAGDTVFDWEIDGSGYSRVHAIVEGDLGRTEAWLEWQREQDNWLIKSASYLLPTGERMPIPLGAGKFLSAHDLAAWRAANPDIPLGRGQRELIEGRSFQAIQLFNSTLDEDPENTEALLWRGKAFESVGNLQKALADYQRILSFDAGNSAALSRLDGLRASPPPGTVVPEMPAPEPQRNSPARATSLIPE